MGENDDFRLSDISRARQVALRSHGQRRESLFQTVVAAVVSNRELVDCLVVEALTLDRRSSERQISDKSEG
jgi:hypothetical protein